MKRAKRVFFALTVIFFLSAGSSSVFCYPVVLQNATATFSQGPLPVSETINGNFSGGGGEGWGIAGPTTSQTAVWETASDLTATSIEFKMHQLQDIAPGGWLIGRFRWSVTTDNRSTFADGLSSGGDVTANWMLLSSPTIAGPSGTTFTDLGDDSILVGGTNHITGVYTVTYNNISQSVITGFRLEVLEHNSLPFNGPGRYSSDGNFVLTELEVSATPIPEPTTITLLGIGLAGLAGTGVRRRYKKKAVGKS